MTAVQFDQITSELLELVLDMAPERLPDGVDAEVANFVDDLGYHSVALVELGFAVEEHFGLEPITAEEVEDVQTTVDLAHFVAGRLGID